jgi:hypothetical protein
MPGYEARAMAQTGTLSSEFLADAEFHTQPGAPFLA